jgi:hypothetical protein
MTVLKLIEGLGLTEARIKVFDDICPKEKQVPDRDEEACFVVVVVVVVVMVKGPSADATDAPQPSGLLCNSVMKMISFIFPSNGTPVE